MALVPGSQLSVGQLLRTNDRMQSPNKFFYAFMQADGNFCAYRGTGPADSRGVMWATKKYAPGKAQYFAVQQDDGNFCVYKGTGPEDNWGIWWASNKYDPIVDYRINSIVYDIARAVVLKTPPVDACVEYIRNASAVQQTTTIGGSATVQEARGWSDTLGIKVGVQTSFAFGVPVLAEGKVQVSTEVSNTYTWSGSETESKIWTFSTPVTVPSGAEGVVFVDVQMSAIAVPYTMSGTFVFRSGTTFQGAVHGMFVGTNSHDLNVTFRQLPIAVGG